MNYAAGKIGTGAFALGSTPASLFSYALSDTGTQFNLVVSGNPAPDTAYWRGNLSGGNGTVWNANSGSTTNWSIDQAGTTDPSAIPSGNTTVNFVANNANLANLNTTLGTAIGVYGLVFNTSHAVTIGGSNALTIGAGGITINSGAHTISASGLVVGNTQTWTNNSASPFTVTAPISGGNSSTYLTLSGSGLFVLSGPAPTRATLISPRKHPPHRKRQRPGNQHHDPRRHAGHLRAELHGQ